MINTCARTVSNVDTQVYLHTQRIRTNGNRRTVTAQRGTRSVIVAPTRVSSQHEIINPNVKTRFTKPLTAGSAGWRRTLLAALLLGAVPFAHRRLPALSFFRVLIYFLSLRW